MAQISRKPIQGIPIGIIQNKIGVAWKFQTVVIGIIYIDKYLIGITDFFEIFRLWITQIGIPHFLIEKNMKHLRICIHKRL